MLNEIGTVFGLLTGKVKFALIGILAATFLVCTAGAYGTGYIIGLNKGKAEAELVIANFRADKAEQISKLNEKITDLNGKTTIEYVDRWNTIREKEYIDKGLAENVVPAQKDLSSGWVYLHDRAATSLPADPVLTADKEPSGVMDNTALSTIVSNYARCTQDQNTLISLQNWIEKYNSEVRNTNKESKK